MLTGDKRETAKNIGLACNLIDPDMDMTSGPHLNKTTSSGVTKTTSSSVSIATTSNDPSQMRRLVQITGVYISNKVDKN